MNLGFKISPAIFAASLLAFLLPFATVSCGEVKVATLSGMQLAVGTTIEQPRPFGQPQKQKVDADPAATVAGLCAVLATALGFLGPRMAIAPAISGFAGAVSLLFLKFRMDDAIRRQGQGVLAVEYEPGFTIALLLLLAGAGWCTYVFTQRKRAVLPLQGAPQWPVASGHSSTEPFASPPPADATRPGAPAASAPRFCPACGAPRKAGSKFCGVCGKPLGVEAPRPEPSVPETAEVLREESVRAPAPPPLVSPPSVRPPDLNPPAQVSGLGPPAAVVSPAAPSLAVPATTPEAKAPAVAGSLASAPAQTPPVKRSKALPTAAGALLVLALAGAGWYFWGVEVIVVSVPQDAQVFIDGQQFPAQSYGRFDIPHLSRRPHTLKINHAGYIDSVQSLNFPLTDLTEWITVRLTPDQPR